MIRARRAVRNLCGHAENSTGLLSRATGVDLAGCSKSSSARPQRAKVRGVTFSPAQPRAAEQLISHVGYVEDLNDARPMLGKSASLGKEAVLAASGMVGELVAGVGRVRRAAFSASD
jgi:hypothetical protein